MAYDNTNTGALFKNKKKKEETHPDYTGVLNAAGVDYILSAYLATSKTDGSTYMRLKLKPKGQT
jgi:hypothetical protein